MKVSYNWLKKHINGTFPSPSKLKDIFSFHLFEVEEVKKRGKDFIFDLDILPNRASDCLSFFGVARELGVILRKKVIHLLFFDLKKIKSKKIVDFELRSKGDCRRYIGIVVKGVKVKESPKEIKEELKKVGLEPINNIVDILNYAMLETGQPLHAFDLDKIGGKKIVIRRAKKGERITTLDGREFKLDKSVLLIADKESPLVIAGVKGGTKTAITKDTEDILIESANFSPIIVRKSRQKIGIQTDASLRFEHNVPVYFADLGIARALYLFRKYKIGKEFYKVIDFSLKKDKTNLVKLSLDKLEKLAGISFSKKEVMDILRRLGFKIISSSEREIKVETPLWRKDISLSEDLIEEILRIEGYNRIKPIFPKAEIYPVKLNENIYWERRVKDFLISLDFSEVYNYSFISQRVADYFGFRNLIEVKNPLSENQKYLRPCLLPNLFKNTAINQKYFPKFQIFELGKIYYNTSSNRVREERRLAGVLFNKNKESKKEVFFELKGMIESLLNSLGVTDVWFDEFKPVLKNFKRDAWDHLASADIRVGNKLIGSVGISSDKFSKGLGIDGISGIFDVNFDLLQKMALEEQEFEPISPYPEVIRDISVLVPAETKVAEILNVINIAGGKLVRDVDLFDMYEGENLPGGKKSLAFHVVYQSKNRTLTSEEVDKVHKKIIQSIENNLNWEVRK